MTTLEKLQQLADGEFHRLCDDLFRRLEPRYRRLRTHGLNAQGVSIKGQPDSYVGQTADTCTIAFQYSVDKGNWWNKIIQDVQDAVKASPRVQEIVVVTPRNIDREGPKSVDWLTAAKAAAGNATLQPPYDGRDIARMLDEEHQDLRYEHLRIPYSRLNGPSILASCEAANSQVVKELIESGRYDPARYSPRDADRTFFSLWQRALHLANGTASSKRRLVRLIALVNDSGVGKTSLLATFVRSLGAAVPAVILQARDLTLASENSLVTHVVHVLQGVLNPEARDEEEAAIVYHLASCFPLTVVVDGLDEAKDVEAVRKAITFWLKSKIGQASALIVSSRPEFWKACVDGGWGPYMFDGDLDDRTPTVTALGSSVKRTDRTDGIRLPDRFTAEELETAWVRAGCPPAHLFALPRETHEELHHPFTLRVYLDLLAQGGGPPRQTTQADLLRAWLDRRLDTEIRSSDRLSHQQFEQALVTIAIKLSEAGGGSLSVDDLSGVPRFDPHNPPGLVVERLLAANILESVPGRRDRIRFTVEAVQEFYRAEGEMATIDKAPALAAEEFARLSFTEAYPRLSRIAQLLGNSEAHQQFVACLASADACKAAVVMRSAPSKYPSSVREQVVSVLGQHITSRHRVRAALAIHLLSDLPCEEATRCLTTYLLPPAQPHQYLKNVAAEAFIRLGVVAGVELVYDWPWFGLHNIGRAYYFKDMLGVMRNAPPEFKTALAEYARQRLGAASGQHHHGRAVCILAYLGDNRLAPHLSTRLDDNGRLLEYENHALIALGTAEAGEVFARSARTAAGNIAKLGYEDGGAARYELHLQVSSPSADYRYLYTPQLERHIIGLICDGNSEVAYLGYDLAKRSESPALVYHAIRALLRWNWTLRFASDFTAGIPPDTWLRWWKETDDIAVRRVLADYPPVVPNVEIEQILIDCLESPDHRVAAAQHLGQSGCYRAAAYLRQVLQSELGDTTLWQKTAAANALGRLQDQASVESLGRLALEHPNTDLALCAVSALGFVGSPEAERTLGSLLGTQVDDTSVAGALLCCGSPSAISRAIELARSKEDGPKWLCECLHRAFWFRGWHVGEYYTHLSTAELTRYLASEEPRMVGEDDRWKLVFGLQPIDSEEVRQLFRKWASRWDTPDDPVLRGSDQLRMSRLCYEELMHRGDPFAISYFVDYRGDERDDIYVHLATDNLSHFPSNAVAAELRRRLGHIGDNSQAFRLLSLLGRFGEPSDESLIHPFLNHPDDLVANTACESLLRLTDPLAVPAKWGKA
jgi:hypothetical protein